jgi:uncharacterized repeat protein (TIGR01451 family)
MVFTTFVIYTPSTTNSRETKKQKVSEQNPATRNLHQFLNFAFKGQGGSTVNERKISNRFLSVALGALSTVAVALPVTSSANDLSVTAEQPTVVGNLGAGTESKKASYQSNVYIVQLEDDPVATYMGEIPGLEATSNRATGANKLDTNSKASKKYEAHLQKKQAKFVTDSNSAIGRSLNVSRDFQIVLNGVAAELSEAEADALRSMPGVKSVVRERYEVPLTDVGPGFINAPFALSGPPNNVPHSMGEGIVIAILDSGINSDHPSFADIGGDGYDHTNPLGSGNYVPGSYCDVVDPSFCNDKLIGAWDFTGPADGTSPEDTDGHGSHTAATAGGNVISGATLVAPTTSLSRDISGVLPHASIIAYDVCIDSCPGSALIAAMEQVVIDAANLPDGVHALNYSISGGGDPYNDSVELAFLNATAAGVYVAASAGNAGPGASTNGHSGPWVSTTGASTHSRTIPNSLTDINSGGGALGDITGLGLTSGYGPAPIVHASDFPTSNGSSNDTDPAQCLDPFPSGTFSGEIVVCDRGTIARVAKGANVLAGGAGGFVLANVDAQGESIVGDAHFLPGVHIGDSDGDVLRAYLAANSDAEAAISGFSVNIDVADGDIMAGFSSRGPATAVDVIKPDVTAPGVSIFAAEADGQAAAAPEYQFLSGTSMSSPHNAGAGALISAVRPDWSPYQVRSALMMTATRDSVLKEDGATPADPFDMGAGRLNLERAQEVGVTLDETPDNFLNANPGTGGDPKTLNLASMQDSVCVGECSWTRTITNVEAHTIHLDADTTGPAGLGLSVSPSNIKVKSGQSADITVTADTTLAPGGWNFGSLELARKGDGPDLHMPIAVNGVTTSNPGVLSKTVDAAAAAEGEPLNYQIDIINGRLTGQIDLEDVLPDGVSFVPGSESEVVSNGTTTSPFSESGGVLTWSGMLDPGGLQITASPLPFGYIPLSVFGVPSFGCPSNCDDGAFILNIPTFTYNGASYSQVIWSVNGTIEAGISSLLAASANNRSMPDAAPPNNLIAPFWTDLNLGAGGDWRVAVLNAGPRQFTVYEWDNVPRFGNLADRYTFQIWVENGAAGNIWFGYAQLGSVADGTVGVENADATNGFTYYFEGAGTAPAVGTDLLVGAQTGGTATFTFQAEIDDCTTGEAIVNRADVDTASTSDTAIAVTECVE